LIATQGSDANKDKKATDKAKKAIFAWTFLIRMTMETQNIDYSSAPLNLSMSENTEK
jgi:hypothetical protein